MLHALVNAGLLSPAKAQAMGKIKNRIQIIDRQLNYLYKSPVKNSGKICQLESLQSILRGAK